MIAWLIVIDRFGSVRETRNQTLGQAGVSEGLQGLCCLRIPFSLLSKLLAFEILSWKKKSADILGWDGQGMWIEKSYQKVMKNMWSWISSSQVWSLVNWTKDRLKEREKWEEKHRLCCFIQHQGNISSECCKWYFSYGPECTIHRCDI